MEQSQKASPKLVAFAALVLLCAGLPHFLLDRKAADRAPGQYSVEALLPPVVGSFQVVNREQGVLGRGIEHVAIYQDSARRRTAQFALITNYGIHNGVACYLARGMPVQWRRVEEMKSADSSATFEIVSLGDQSLKGGNRSALFIASTECTTVGCREIPLEIRSGLQLGWIRKKLGTESISAQRRPVPLSITFQSTSVDGSVKTQEQALSEFRELISNFKLNPLRELSASN
jgi:hypothetical protein